MRAPPPRSIPLLLLILALPASAGDQVGASFRLRGANLNAGGTPGAVGSTSQRSGVSIGQSEALGLSGGSSDLTTSAPGLWPVVAGTLPSLDLDGDGMPAYLDPDDDDDGLLDVVETGTGVFVSASDTGTDPLDLDTDDDGFPDGVEVGAGSDPNDAGAIPVFPVPALPSGLLVLLAFGLAAAALWCLPRTRRS